VNGAARAPGARSPMLEPGMMSRCEEPFRLRQCCEASLARSRAPYHPAVHCRLMNCGAERSSLAQGM
jgi:hypothetical protein